MHATNLEIEDAILSVLQARWQKVAMVIGKVHKTLCDELPEGDPRWVLILELIHALDESNRIESIGDISRPRHSEIRLHGSHVTVSCDRHHPCLSVPDVSAAVDFYTSKLGFTQAFTVGTPPAFAGLNLDA